MSMAIQEDTEREQVEFPDIELFVTFKNSERNIKFNFADQNTKVWEYDDFETKGPKRYEETDCLMIHSGSANYKDLRQKDD